MKRLLVLLVIVCAGFTQLHAQDKSKQKAQRLTDSMTVRLGLTPDQIPKVKAINEEFAAKAADAKSSDAGKLGKLKKVKSAGKGRNEALKEVLTADQYKLMLEQQKEMKEEMKEKRKEKKGK
jgi:hypothetical protein